MQALRPGHWRALMSHVTQIMWRGLQTRSDTASQVLCLAHENLYVHTWLFYLAQWNILYEL